MDKQRLKQAIWGAECKIVAVLEECVSLRKSKEYALSRARAYIYRIRGLTHDEMRYMIRWASEFHRRAVLACKRKKEPEERRELIYDEIISNLKELTHDKNDLADEVEERAKRENLAKLKSSHNHFFLCTVHIDSAPDHAALQGRAYYLESALNEMTREERDYIRAENLLSVEEVTSDPHWLCTRPNCRHRLVPVAFEKLKTGTATPPTVLFKPKSYEQKQLLKYKNRVKMLLALRKAGVRSEKLRRDLDRARKLVKKWEAAV